MSDTYTYTEARQKLAKILDDATENNDVIVIKRRNAKDAVVLSKTEYASMEETIHLFRSPANAARLIQSIEDARKKINKPMTIEELKKAVGFEE